MGQIIENRTKETVAAEIVTTLNKIDETNAMKLEAVAEYRDKLKALRATLLELRNEIKNGIQPRLPLAPSRSHHANKK